MNSCHFWPKSIETNLDIELNDRKTVCSAQHSITKPAAAHGYEVQMTSILRLLSPVGTHVSPYYPSFLRTICSSYVFQPKPNWGGTRLFGLHLPTQFIAEEGGTEAQTEAKTGINGKGWLPWLAQ